MANQHLPLPFLLLSSFLFSTIVFSIPETPNSSKPPKLTKELAVEGVVLCQSCKQAGTWSLTGAKPLPSAKVGIACKDFKNRVKYYKAVKSDDNGYFYTPLRGSEIKRYYLDHPIHACTVRLLSSPDEACNLLTNINSGIEGAALRDENKTVAGRSYEAVVYSAGPLAFRPATCVPTRHY